MPCVALQNTDLPLFAVRAFWVPQRVRNSARGSAGLPLAVDQENAALVLVQAEPATAPVLGQGQAWEAVGQARVWGWAEHPVRQRLVQVRVTYAPHRS
jgi:hypothetical protein